MNTLRVSLLALTAAATLLESAPVKGDSDGYVDNWLGTVRIQYKHQNDPVVGLPNAAKLKDSVDALWVPANVCARLQTGIPNTQWRSCRVADGGTAEMRGLMLGQNRLGLKYLTKGNAVSFLSPMPKPLGSYADQEVDAQFDMELDVVVDFDTYVDGSSSDPAKPAVVKSAVLKFSNAKFYAADPSIAVDEKLREAEATMNSRQQDLLARTSGGRGGPPPVDVSSVNLQLHEGAQAIQPLAAAAQPGANSHFNLDVFIDRQFDDLFVLQFRRDQDAPAAPRCVSEVICGPVVSFSCPTSFASQGHYFSLERLLPIEGNRAPVHATAQWSRVTSSAVPVLADESIPASVVSRTYRLCEGDTWGVNCALPAVVGPIGHEPCKSGSPDGPRKMRCHVGLFGKLICLPVQI